VKVPGRDFLGRSRVAEIPVPVRTPGTILVRTAWSYKWSGDLRQPSLARLAALALRRPWRVAHHAYRYVAARETRDLNLALHHHLRAQNDYQNDTHTCFSVSGCVEESAQETGSRLTPGSLVAGLGFKAPSHAPFQVVSRCLLVPVPDDGAL
jgi:hypothetical protein